MLVATAESSAVAVSGVCSRCAGGGETIFFFQRFAASRAATMPLTARFHWRKLFVVWLFSRFSSRFVLPSMVSEAEGASSAGFC